MMWSGKRPPWMFSQRRNRRVCQSTPPARERRHLFLPLPAGLGVFISSRNGRASGVFLTSNAMMRIFFWRVRSKSPNQSTTFSAPSNQRKSASGGATCDVSNAPRQDCGPPPRARLVPEARRDTPPSRLAPSVTVFRRHLYLLYKHHPHQPNRPV